MFENYVGISHHLNANLLVTKVISSSKYNLYRMCYYVIINILLVKNRNYTRSSLIIGYFVFSWLTLIGVILGRIIKYKIFK